MAYFTPAFSALLTLRTLPVEFATLVFKRFKRLPVVIEVEAIFSAVPVVRVSQFQTCAKFALAMVWPAAAAVIPDSAVLAVPALEIHEVMPVPSRHCRFQDQA